MLGAWPSSGVDDELVRRVSEFMLKALKEAKVHTSWITPNVEYEEAVLEFVRAILDPSDGALLEDFAQLQQKVRELGGDPERSGSTTGQVHRFWVNLRSTIAGMDEHAILDECERGEDAAKRAYEEALQQDLPADVRTMIGKQYREVKINHDSVRDMRNAMA